MAIMKYLKFLSISLIYVFVLILYLVNDANHTLIGIIFDSFGISCFSALYFLLLLIVCKISLPEKIYKIHEFEKSGKFYQLTGVRAFKTILAKYPFPTFTGKFELKGYSMESVGRLEKQLIYSETIHFLAFITTFIVILPFGYFRDYRFYYYMTLFNIIVNLYPALVQRYNRNRINRILGA